MYKLIRFIFSLLIRLLCRVTVIGLEHITAVEGSLLVAANHLGRMDAFLIYPIIPRDDLIVIVAEKYQKHAFFRWLARQMDGLFIDRFNADFRTVRQVLRRLQKGMSARSHIRREERTVRYAPVNKSAVSQMFLVL